MALPTCDSSTKRRVDLQPEVLGPRVPALGKLKQANLSHVVCSNEALVRKLNNNGLQFVPVILYTLSCLIHSTQTSSCFCLSDLETIGIPKESES